MLREAGYIAHVPGEPDTFKTGTLDAEWLPAVGARQWILITKDKSIRKHNIEIEALHGAQVRTFVLTASNVRGEEQALIMKEALPAMLRLLRRRSSHFIARVTGQSNVEIIEFHKHGKVNP